MAPNTRHSFKSIIERYGSCFPLENKGPILVNKGWPRNKRLLAIGLAFIPSFITKKKQKLYIFYKTCPAKQGLPQLSPPKLLNMWKQQFLRNFLVKKIIWFVPQISAGCQLMNIYPLFDISLLPAPYTPNYVPNYQTSMFSLQKPTHF